MSARNRLPNRRANSSFGFEFEGHRYRASAAWFDDGRLGEIFLDTDKHGTPLQLNAETAAILTSIALQYGVPVETIRHAVNGPISVALAEFAAMAEGK
jgi:ribonucleoside-diphosphate reductase alpha chain